MAETESRAAFRELLDTLAEIDTRYLSPEYGVNEARDEVLPLLRDHRPQLDSLAEALLEHETLDQTDAYAAAGMEPVGAATVRA